MLYQSLMRRSLTHHQQLCSQQKQQQVLLEVGNFKNTLPLQSQTHLLSSIHFLGTKSSHCGWLSSEEESDSEEDGDDDDDEMIQLSPEPLCEELEDLLAEIRGDRKRKRPTRWDN